MVILEKQKIVLITPPKTGSNYLHHVITPRHWVYGQTGDHVTHHTFLVPEQFQHYTYYVSTRNPYDRVYSIYRHYQHYHQYIHSFHRWLDELCIGWFEKPITWYKDQVRTNVSGTKLRFGGYLKIENTPTNLTSLGIDYLTDGIGPYSLGPPYTKWTEAERMLVLAEYAEDFDTGGYQV